MYSKSTAKSSCRDGEQPITHAEAMRLIESRFGHENALRAKRNLERMMAWYHREGRFNLPNRRSTNV